MTTLDPQKTVTCDYLVTAEELTQVHRTQGLYTFQMQFGNVGRFLYYSRLFSRYLLGTLMAISGGIMVLAGLLELQNSIIPLLFGLLITSIGITALAWGKIRDRIAYNQFARLPDINTRTTYTFNHLDVSVTATEFEQKTFAWSALPRFTRVPNGFLLQAPTGNSLWIPDHGFANPQDIEFVKHVAKQHVSTYMTLS